MQRLPSFLWRILPGAVAVLFTLYIIFRPNGYEHAFELAGLLLVLGITVMSGVDTLRRSTGQHGRGWVYFRVTAGPLLLIAAALWTVLASRLHFQFLPTIVVFLILLGTGMIIIGYGIYTWLVGRR